MIPGDFKRARGQALTSNLWNSVMERLPGIGPGPGAAIAGVSRTLAAVENNTGADIELGQVVSVESLNAPDGAFNAGSGVFVVRNPAWHTASDEVLVAAEPIPNNQQGLAVVSGFALIKATDVSVSLRYLHIDPLNTKQAKPGSGGFAKYMGRVPGGDNTSLGVIGHTQKLWRYKLKEDSLAPNDTAAELLNFDGTQYAATIALSDPLSFMGDQKLNDEGVCLEVGNKFVAIQAKCSTAGP